MRVYHIFVEYRALEKNKQNIFKAVKSLHDHAPQSRMARSKRSPYNLPTAPQKHSRPNSVRFSLHRS